jgi:hypothetical protein
LCSPQAAVGAATANRKAAESAQTALSASHGKRTAALTAQIAEAQARLQEAGREAARWRRDCEAAQHEAEEARARADDAEDEARAMRLVARSRNKQKQQHLILCICHWVGCFLSTLTVKAFCHFIPRLPYPPQGLARSRDAGVRVAARKV